MTVDGKTSFLTCSICGGDLANTTDSRPTVWNGHKTIRRRRVCANCGARETTFELPTGVMDGMEMQMKKRLLKHLMEGL